MVLFVHWNQQEFSQTRAIMGYWEVLGMISRVMVVTNKITSNVRWLVHFLIPARKDSKAQILNLLAVVKIGIFRNFGSVNSMLVIWNFKANTVVDNNWGGNRPIL